MSRPQQIWSADVPIDAHQCEIVRYFLPCQVDAIWVVARRRSRKVFLVAGEFYAMQVQDSLIRTHYCC